MLDHFKIAKVDSGLLPIAPGKPPAAAAAPKRPFLSSLGSNMRHETEQALERGLKHGALAAMARFKIAEGMGMAIHPAHQDLLFAQHGNMGHDMPAPAAPAARPSVGWGEFRRGAAQHVADAANPGAMAMAPQATRRTPLAPHLPAPQSAAVAAHAAPAAAAAAAPAAGSMLSRFKMPSIGMKGALGLGLAGAAGAAMLGMHRQNQQDRDANRLTYAPMQGGFY